jgi:uncharacterized membrane protein YdjX (TVP38/TMEM64 family)/type II secretory pathway pseudopilin PulG
MMPSAASVDGDRVAVRCCSCANVLKWLGRIAVGGILLCLSVGAFWYLLSAGYITALLQWIDNIGWIGYVLMMCLLVVVHIPFVLGYGLVSTACGFLYGFQRGLILIVVGGNVGCHVGYWVTRLLLHKRIKSNVERGGVGLKALMGEINAHPWKIGVVVRLNPIPIGFQNALLAVCVNVHEPITDNKQLIRWVIDWMCGVQISQMRYWVYSIASALGMLPRQVLYVYLGSSILDIAMIVSGKYEFGWPQGAMVAIALCGIVASIGLSVFLGRRAMRAARQMQLENEQQQQQQQQQDDDDNEVQVVSIELVQVVSASEQLAAEQHQELHSKSTDTTTPTTTLEATMVNEQVSQHMSPDAMSVTCRQAIKLVDKPVAACIDAEHEHEQDQPTSAPLAKLTHGNAIHEQAVALDEQQVIAAGAPIEMD